MTLSGQKRAFEKLVSADFAKYGFTSGSLKKVSHLDLSCGVICLRWPGLALAAHLRGFKVKVIIMKDPYWFHKTVTWFPGAEVILHQAGFKISTSFYKIKLWLSEIDPPRAFCLWSSDASVVIGT